MNSTSQSSPFTRRSVIGAIGLALFAALILVAGASPARADAAAETYMQGILNDANIVFEAETEEARFDGIEVLVNQYVDMQYVSMSALGQYRLKMTDAQRAVYYPLFKRYLTSVYQGILSDYAGERLEIVRSIDRSPRDIVVETKIAGARPGDKFHDVIVHWRIRRDRDDNEMSIIDAGADGIWLAIQMQDQFKSIIANNGSGTVGIDALIADLAEQVGE